VSSEYNYFANYGSVLISEWHFFLKGTDVVVFFLYPAFVVLFMLQKIALCCFMFLTCNDYMQTTASESGLFDHLINVWEFKPGPVPGTCDLYFLVDFKFQSPLYRQVNHVFNDTALTYHMQICLIQYRYL
jgi:hypothetical protein